MCKEAKLSNRGLLDFDIMI